MGLGLVWEDNDTGSIKSKVAEIRSVVSDFGTVTTDIFTKSVSQTSPCMTKLEQC